MNDNIESYFVSWKGRRDGPFSLDQLAGLLQRGELSLLHRVETPEGAVPLRQLLLATDPERFAALAVPPGGGGQTEESSGTPLRGAALPPAPPPPPRNPSARLSRRQFHEPQEPARIYALCGLSFLLPPLAVWSWMLATGVGDAEQSARLKNLSMVLGIAGIGFWAAVYFLW